MTAGLYLAIAKRKKPRAKNIRYLRLNLGIKEKPPKDDSALALLSGYERRCLETIRVFYSQQLTAYGSHTHSDLDRIVSISQPHLRPSVRDKAAEKAEFGAKVSISHFKEGYVAESYWERFGHHPVWMKT